MNTNTNNNNDKDKDKEENNNNSVSDTYMIAAKVSSIGIEMVVPVLFGVWFDYLFSTVVIFAILGAISGTALAFWHLIKISNKLS
ncbi:MAG: AtpZ/AtpI family protein [Planctomycetaceae bacterium]|jgi:F0F1-type ATP synthase assembly protein I|nr:AtpZ/AtpI family protein [Planctomycetaceae bacterium]